jgi:hypothetical protein
MIRIRRHVRASVLGLATALAAAPQAAAQAATQTAAPAAGERTAPGYVAPRTAFGQPDLQGVWSNASNTRMTRPDQFKTLILSDEEAAKAQEVNPLNVRQRTDDNQRLEDGLLDGSDLRGGRGYNAFWIDPGTHYGNVRGTFRTSWIVDPADGQIPYSEAGRKLMSETLRARRGTGYDHPEERSLGERCIIGFGGTGGPPMNNVLYNNHYQIVQTPDHVMIMVEMNHDARVIPLVAGPDAATPRPAALSPYLGDSVGWWEGDTLVVETRNFHPWQAGGGGAAFLTAAGKVTERFTRWSDRQILYEFTVEDPAVYTQPWRGEMSLNADDERIFEYACHEGNYGLHGILAGGRANDAKGITNKPGGFDEG